MDDDIKSIDEALKALMIDIGCSSYFPLDQENINIDIFITLFGTIYWTKTVTTNLANFFFEHTIIKSNPDSKHYKLNHFTYIISKIHTLDEAENSKDR